MKYEQHERELNFIKDKSLHKIIATLSENERRRICVSISGCEDENEVDLYAEAVIEQINSEKRQTNEQRPGRA